MARNFGGADYVTLGVGALTTIAQGAATMAAVVRKTTDLSNDCLMSMDSTVTAEIAFFGGGSADNNLRWVRDGSATSVAIPLTNADGFSLVAISKASGTTNPRGHKYVYGTNAWSHANAAGTSANSNSLSGGKVQLGRLFNLSGQEFSGDMAIAGAWLRVLSDAEVETLPFSLAAWLSTAPDALWLLDQSSTSQNVIDMTGLGSNQTALTGTAVASTSVPGFGYGHPILVATSVATVVVEGSAALSADAGLTATGLLEIPGTAVLAADADLDAAAILEIQAGAGLAGDTTLAAQPFAAEAALAADATLDAAAEVILRILDWHWYGSLVYSTVEERDRAYERISDMMQATSGSEPHPDPYYGTGLEKQETGHVGESEGPGVTWSYRLVDPLLYDAEVLAGDLRDHALDGQTGSAQLED